MTSSNDDDDGSLISRAACWRPRNEPLPIPSGSIVAPFGDAGRRAVDSGRPTSEGATNPDHPGRGRASVASGRGHKRTAFARTTIKWLMESELGHRSTRASRPLNYHQSTD